MIMFRSVVCVCFIYLVFTFLGVCCILYGHKKNGTFYNMIHRAYIYTQHNKEHMNREIKYIKKIAKQNGYKENLINSLQKRYYNKRNNSIDSL